MYMLYTYEISSKKLYTMQEPVWYIPAWYSYDHPLVTPLFHYSVILYVFCIL